MCNQFKFRFLYYWYPPKKEGEWRMNSHLSHILVNSIIDHIDQQYCWVSYSTFDQALSLINEIDEGAFMAKMDMHFKCFRMLPICPEELCLLSFKFKFILCWQMFENGMLNIMFNIWDVFSFFIGKWIKIQIQGGVIHYLGDFIYG